MPALSWNDIVPRTAARVASAREHLHVVPAPEPRWRAALLGGITLVLAVAAGLAAFTLLANATYEVGPTRIAVAARPALAGSTTLSLPPFGSVSAETHRAPLAVTASLQEVDLTRLQSLALAGMPNARTIDAFKAEATRGAEQAVGKGLLAALVASAFVGWALRRSWRTTLASGVLGVVVPALLVGSAVTGFHAQAFRTPRYEGAMRYAPSLIGLVQGRLAKVGTLQAQLNDAVRQLVVWYAKPQSFAAGGTMPHTFRVLQVSDLHLDPIGFKLESDLADEFKVSVVLDCGDADDYGTPLEGAMLQRFLDTRRPRIFVPGNHESPAIVNAIASMRNTTVLASSTVTIDGLTVYGVADPMSRSDGWKPNNDVALAEGTAAAEKLRENEATGGPKPQIVATHNPVELQPFGDLAPLLVAGHTHTPDMGRIGSSWYLNSGTVGGVDFAKLYEDPAIPHGASILYFTDTLPRRLVAIDQISVWGRTDQSSLKRTVIDPQLLQQLTAEKPTPARPAAKPVPKPAKR